MTQTTGLALLNFKFLLTVPTATFDPAEVIHVKKIQLFETPC